MFTAVAIVITAVVFFGLGRVKNKAKLAKVESLLVSAESKAKALASQLEAKAVSEVKKVI